MLFRFPRALSEGEERRFFEHIRSWPDAIDVRFLRLRVGRDDSGRALGYQYAMHSEFESKEAMAAYQAHPVHQAFSLFVRDRECEVLAFDYELGPHTVVSGD